MINCVMSKKDLNKKNKGKLYIVATPIGNMKDITLRALEVIQTVDVIFCEDTRITKKLCSFYNIDCPKMVSLNARTEERKIPQVISALSENYSVAYLSDAGTPGISDPGVRVVAEARKLGFEVVSVPGASALVSALSVAGVAVDKFCFYGFLPQKKGREKLLKEFANTKHTVVFYESSHRIVKLLKQLQEIAPQKQVTVAKELTKIHEQILQGTPTEVLEIFEQDPQKQKGEFTVILSL